MNRAGLFLLLASLASLPAIAADESAEREALAAVQTQGDVVRGDFVQEKHLAELDQPLISKGRYVIARDHGLIWRVQDPLTTTLIISQRALLQRSQGQETLRISADKQPGLSVVTAVLLAVFQADTERLKNYFEIESLPADAGNWALQLQPKQASVAEFISSVKIAGGKNIERIDIAEAGGDRSVLRLTSAQADPAGLRAEEKSEFGDCPDC